MIREGPHSGPFVVLWVEQSVEVTRGMQCLHTREVGDLLPARCPRRHHRAGGGAHGGYQTVFANQPRLSGMLVPKGSGHATAPGIGGRGIRPHGCDGRCVAQGTRVAVAVHGRI